MQGGVHLSVSEAGSVWAFTNVTLDGNERGLLVLGAESVQLSGGSANDNVATGLYVQTNDDSDPNPTMLDTFIVLEDWVIARNGFVGIYVRDDSPYAAVSIKGRKLTVRDNRKTDGSGAGILIEQTGSTSPPTTQGSAFDFGTASETGQCVFANNGEYAFLVDSDGGVVVSASASNTYVHGASVYTPTSGSSFAGPESVTNHWVLSAGSSLKFW